MMSPMWSLCLSDIKSRTTLLATVIRLGEISSASIESEMSNTIMISCGIRCSRVDVLTILTPEMMATRLEIMSIRMSQRSQIVFGVRRYLAIRALGWVAPIFSLPKRYHSTIMAGTRRRTMGWESAICIIVYPLADKVYGWFTVFSFTVSSLLICSFSSTVRSCLLYSARSSCSMISMSLGSWLYDAIRPGIWAQLCSGWWV